MAYIFVEEIPEGFEEAEVIPIDDYNNLQETLNETIKQRDEAVERAVTAEEGWQKAREKFANTFLSTPAKIKEEESAEKINLTAQSFDSLFKIG